MSFQIGGVDEMLDGITHPQRDVLGVSVTNPDTDFDQGLSRTIPTGRHRQLWRVVRVELRKACLGTRLYLDKDILRSQLG